MTRLKHVSFITADADATARFYVLLGAHIEKDLLTSEGYRRLVLSFEGGKLQFFQLPHEAPRPHHSWAEHVAVHLPDLAATLERLNASKVRFSRDLSTTPSGNPVAFVLDPDGRQVELLQS